MGEKILSFVFMISAVAVFINAQTVDRSQYKDTSLFDYKLWANKAQNGDTEKFKAPVVFSGQTGISFYFDDPEGNNLTTFEVQKRWIPMERNQQVTIYFTVTGQETCVIDDIDYDNTAAAVQSLSNTRTEEEPMFTVPAASSGITPAAAPVASRSPTAPVVSMIPVIPRVPAPTPTAVPAPAPAAVQASAPAAVPASDPATVPASDPATVPTPAPVAVPASDPAAVPASAPAAVPASAPAAVPASAPAAVPAPTPTAVQAPAPATVQASAPVAVQAPDPAAVQAPTPVTVPASVPAAVPARISPPVPPPAKFFGNIPQRGSGKIYRLQVGSFLQQANAVRAFNKLQETGLNPAYEKYGDYTRVVLTGIRADDVSLCAKTIGAAGFPEIWCREER